MADLVAVLVLLAAVGVLVSWVAGMVEVFVQPRGDFALAGVNATVWRTVVTVGVGVGSVVYWFGPRRRVRGALARIRGERAQVDPKVLADVAPETGVAKPDPILVAEGVRRRFGGLVAVDVDHLEIQRGLITGLIGPNGAGKTTFFNLLTGFDAPDQGRWEFNGQDLSGLAAHRVAERGMVRTFQLTKALSKMTVLDNMMLGATGQRGEGFALAFARPAWRDQEAEIHDRAQGLLDRFGIAHMADEYAGTLSGGQRKLLEMARALMTEPELVMLDEPMAGVNPVLTQSLLGHVKALRDEGMTVIFVEHDMDVVRDISDWVVVMAEGDIIAEGTHDDITGDPRVIDAYLGTQHGESAAAGPVTPAHQESETEDG